MCLKSCCQCDVKPCEAGLFVFCVCVCVVCVGVTPRDETHTMAELRRAGSVQSGLGSPRSSTPSRPPTPALSPAAAAVMRCADDIKWLSWNAAWHAANVLARCDGAAHTDLQRFEHHASALERELPRELADAVRSMVWSACWHAANSRGGTLRSMASVMEEEEGEDGAEEDQAGDEEDDEEEVGKDEGEEEEWKEEEEEEEEGEDEEADEDEDEADEPQHDENEDGGKLVGESTTTESPANAA